MKQVYIHISHYWLTITIWHCITINGMLGSWNIQQIERQNKPQEKTEKQHRHSML